MKLRQYISEQVRYSKDAIKYKSKAKKIINKHMSDVEKELKYYRYNVTISKLCIILSSIYMQNDIRFIHDEDPQFKGYSYVIGSDFYKNGDIELFISDDTINHMNNNKKLFSDIFTNEFNSVLSHVLVKRDRILRMKDEFEWIGYTPIKKYITDNIDYYIWLTKQELEDNNFSPTRSMLYDLVGQLPVYKKYKKGIS